MKRRPQPASAGRARGRSSMGASARPIQRSRSRQTPGAFQGSAMLGVSMPPLAWLAPVAGPPARSIRVTSWPRTRR